MNSPDSSTSAAMDAPATAGSTAAHADTLVTPGTPPNPPESENDNRSRRNGKIARLPKAVRDQINIALSDGQEYEKIIAGLGTHGDGLNKGHMHSWFNGGYQDWLKSQALLDQCRIRQELTLDFARENQGVDGIQAAHNITIGLLSQAIAEFGPDTMRDAFQKNPLNLMRAMVALARLTNGELRCQRYQSEDSERKLRLLQGNHKKGISPEVLKEMITKLNLM
jgi:hypothetical protein